MPDGIRRIDHYYTSAPGKPGEDAGILAGPQDAGINLRYSAT